MAKSYFLSFEEFSAVIDFTLRSDLSHLLEMAVHVNGNVDEMELDLKAFKAHMTVAIEWPSLREPTFV